MKCGSKNCSPVPDLVLWKLMSPRDSRPSILNFAHWSWKNWQQDISLKHGRIPRPSPARWPRSLTSPSASNAPGHSRQGCVHIYIYIYIYMYVYVYVYVYMYLHMSLSIYAICCPQVGLRTAKPSRRNGPGVAGHREGAVGTLMVYMRNLLGWLETRLAQMTWISLKMAYTLFIVQGNSSYLKVILR